MRCSGIKEHNKLTGGTALHAIAFYGEMIVLKLREETHKVMGRFRESETCKRIMQMCVDYVSDVFLLVRSPPKNWRLNTLLLTYI